MNYFLRSGLCVLLCAIVREVMPRSIHRASSKRLPTIVVRWKHESKSYRLSHPSLELQPFVSYYQPDYIAQHELPRTEISLRTDPEKKVEGKVLYELLEELVKDLRMRKRLPHSFRHFTILKKQDYNAGRQAGLLILKFKEYPFVVKLFLETPQSLISPFSKGFIQSVFFVMGGGVNRHLSGFSRVPNAEVIRSIIRSDDRWRDIVDVPRKWFWIPQSQEWINITTENMGSTNAVIELPSVYAVICDAIASHESFHLLNREHRQRALELCTFLGVRLDPNISNFMIEASTKKLVLIDTEFFPWMVGLREPLVFASYAQWYCQLCSKCLQDTLGRTKDDRERHHGGAAKPILSWGSLDR